MYLFRELTVQFNPLVPDRSPFATLLELLKASDILRLAAPKPIMVILYLPMTSFSGPKPPTFTPASWISNGLWKVSIFNSGESPVKSSYVIPHHK